jgi:hypothetical protein
MPDESAGELLQELDQLFDGEMAAVAEVGKLGAGETAPTWLCASVSVTGVHMRAVQMAALRKALQRAEADAAQGTARRGHIDGEEPPEISPRLERTPAVLTAPRPRARGQQQTRRRKRSLNASWTNCEVSCCCETRNCARRGIWRRTS